MSKTWGIKRYSIKKKNKHELDNKEFHIYSEKRRERKKEHENFYVNKKIIKRIYIKVAS